MGEPWMEFQAQFLFFVRALWVSLRIIINLGFKFCSAGGLGWVCAMAGKAFGQACLLSGGNIAS